jgi:phosphoribosyl-ATP pyrophosphohydrolase
MSADVLTELAAIIAARRYSAAEKSYTKTLLEAGTAACAKKFGEEAVETVIAAIGEDDAHLKAEAADVLYHLLVLLESRAVPVADVLSLLAARMGRSGLDEKASRSQASE